ncbi:hypothetical protein GW846_02550 [Candidatus Gracilibacteria bacterium]|nr:hypothetical protein [Candidatus Gracilibacteria bacterium]
MKKIACALLTLGLLSPIFTSAATDLEIQAANFLATKNIINDNSLDIVQYNLDSNITRREMLKVMMNISGKTVADTCSGEFSDMNGSDWGCKYAEAALTAGFIAENNTFRPNDQVTQIEALKMVMQAKGLERDAAQDWRAGYVSKAQSENIISGDIIYDTKANRGWIFTAGAKADASFEYKANTSVENSVDTTNGSDPDISPEIEELFNSIFEL